MKNEQLAMGTIKAKSAKRIGTPPACIALACCDIGIAELESGQQVFITWGRNLNKLDQEWYSKNTDFQPIWISAFDGCSELILPEKMISGLLTFNPKIKASIKMELHQPVMITSRLLPGLKIGEGSISIEYDRQASSEIGRIRYRYYIDLPDFEYVDNDLQSGCQGGNLQSGLSSLLSFLSACGESYRYEMSGISPFTWKYSIGESDNNDMFPKQIAEWCYQNSDELSLLACELEEETDLIVE